MVSQTNFKAALFRPWQRRHRFLYFHIDLPVSDVEVLRRYQYIGLYIGSLVQFQKSPLNSKLFKPVNYLRVVKQKGRLCFTTNQVTTVI